MACSIRDAFTPAPVPLYLSKDLDRHVPQASCCKTWADSSGCVLTISCSASHAKACWLVYQMFVISVRAMKFRMKYYFLSASAQDTRTFLHTCTSHCTCLLAPLSLSLTSSLFWQAITACISENFSEWLWFWDQYLSWLMTPLDFLGVFVSGLGVFWYWLGLLHQNSRVSGSRPPKILI